MCQVNVFQAKTEFSKLIALLENGKEDESVIARNGKPVARMVRWDKKATKRRVGVAKGLFTVSDDFDADNDHVAELFGGEAE